MSTAVIEDKKANNKASAKTTAGAKQETNTTAETYAETKTVATSTATDTDTSYTEKLYGDWVAAEGFYKECEDVKSELISEAQMLKSELANPSKDWTPEQISSKQQRLLILPTLIEQAKQKSGEASRAADAVKAKYTRTVNNAREEREVIKEEVRQLSWDLNNRRSEREKNIRAAEEKLAAAQEAVYDAQDELHKLKSVEPMLKANLERAQTRLSELDRILD